jgi:hypothetical protein
MIPGDGSAPKSPPRGCPIIEASGVKIEWEEHIAGQTGDWINSEKPA